MTNNTLNALKQVILKAEMVGIKLNSLNREGYCNSFTPDTSEELEVRIGDDGFGYIATPCDSKSYPIERVSKIRAVEVMLNESAIKFIHDDGSLTFYVIRFYDEENIKLMEELNKAIKRDEVALMAVKVVQEGSPSGKVTVKPVSYNTYEVELRMQMIKRYIRIVVDETHITSCDSDEWAEVLVGTEVGLTTAEILEKITKEDISICFRSDTETHIQYHIIDNHSFNVDWDEHDDEDAYLNREEALETIEEVLGWIGYKISDVSEWESVDGIDYPTCFGISKK